MTYTIVMNVPKEISVPEKGILSHTLHNDLEVKIIAFGFSAGQELSAHTAPYPATIQILQGEAELTLGDDKLVVSAGCLAQMSANLPHAILAKTPTLMLLTMFKGARRPSAAAA